MSTVTRSVFIALVFAASAGAQSLAFANATTFMRTDASGSEMYSASAMPGQVRLPTAGEPGTVSVRELEKPLEGKGLRLITKAKELIARGESAQAMEQLRAAMRDPDAEPYALSILASEHLKQGDFDSAVNELQEAVHMLPGIAANQSNLAYALGVKGRNEEALIAARKALQLDPGRPRTRFVLAQILMQLGDWKEAEFHLTKAADELSGARALLAKYFNPEARSH